MIEKQNWDPLPHERTWYRSTKTGDRAYLVVRDGEDKVRLDRPNEEIIRTLRESDWVVDAEYRPFTRHQVAQLAFVADRFLLRMLGQPNDSRLDWATLREDKRLEWLMKGPGAAGLRSELWSAIQKVFEGHSR